MQVSPGNDYEKPRLLNYLTAPNVLHYYYYIILYVILYISYYKMQVSPGNDYEKPRLLNYLTAPNVLVWSAASASCALPGLYEVMKGYVFEL